jgi:Xaa-Pro aminopeptidase
MAPAQEFSPQVQVKEQSSLYDTDLLPKEFHAGRRDALRKLMADSTVAVFFTSAPKNRSNDVYYEYHQDPNFYYLTGLREPEDVLLIFKNKVQYRGMVTNEILFVKGRDSKVERWTGRRMGVEGARTYLGISSSFSSDSIDSFNMDLSVFKSIYYFDILPQNQTNAWKQFMAHIEGKPNVDTYSLKEMMAKLREVKTKEELALIRKAVNITCEALRETIKAIEPGMNEYDAEAIVEYVFKSRGSEHEGYPSILGAGENSCILHYETNRRKLVSKDLLVCDVGAEYHGYTADVTRTIPVSGKFSETQKAIYNIVLEAQIAAISKCRPGESFRAPHDTATFIIRKRLTELGIIKHPSELGKYFFHGTSHYLGLDVHDLGTYGKLKPNTVITVEPGIYIPFGSDCDEKWWDIGIRIEDDILVTETLPEVLSACVPKTIEEIESLMKEESLFNLMKK